MKISGTSSYTLPPDIHPTTKQTDVLYYALRQLCFRPVLTPECRNCHYTIINLTSPICPECGCDLSTTGYLPAKQSQSPLFLIMIILLAIVFTTTIYKIAAHYESALYQHILISHNCRATSHKIGSYKFTSYQSTLFKENSSTISYTFSAITVPFDIHKNKKPITPTISSSAPLHYLALYISKDNTTNDLLLIDATKNQFDLIPAKTLLKFSIIYQNKDQGNNRIEKLADLLQLHAITPNWQPISKSALNNYIAPSLTLLDMPLKTKPIILSQLMDLLIHTPPNKQFDTFSKSISLNFTNTFASYSQSTSSFRNLLKGTPTPTRTSFNRRYYLCTWLTILLTTTLIFLTHRYLSRKYAKLLKAHHNPTSPHFSITN